MMSNSPSQCVVCRNSLREVIPKVFDTRFGIEKSYSIALCSSCSLLQTAPVPSQTELKHLYETFYNFTGNDDAHYTNLRSMFYRSIFYKIWCFIDGDISFHALKGEGRLLDIGCNEGRGLEFFRSNGFEVEGLEVNSLAASIARKKGFSVHVCEFEKFTTINKYRYVILSNVLEHSLDPELILKSVFNLLEPGGKLFVSCPNSESWLRKIFSTRWINWHVPFHISHFSQRSLTHLLKNAGFKISTFKQETPALWVAHSVISSLFSKPGKATSHLRSPLLVASLIIAIRGLCFPILWLANQMGHGDCCVVVAYKS